MKILTTVLILLGLAGAGFSQKEMNNDRLEKILREEVERIEGEAGSWMVYYGERLLLVMTDEASNRMRVFTPITEQRRIGAEETGRMLEANFHSALDAKYGFYEGFVVSVFTHPLAELTKKQLIDALRQVVTLADTFGTSYSSSNLIFGKEGQKNEKRINVSPSREKKTR